MSSPTQVRAHPGVVDDELLVAAVRGGDDTAFAVLAERHSAWMQALARRLLAQDHHLAQDVTQECLVRLHATITRDERALRVRPWLAVVVRNACMDEHRRHRPEPVADLPDQPVHDEDPFDLDPHLEQAWGALQPRFREVLHHRELLGLSYDEIAVAMGTSRSAVQTLLFRARAALRREYQRAGGQLLGCGAFGLALLASFDGERVGDPGRLAAHLGRCPRCQASVERLGELTGLLRGTGVRAPHVDRLVEGTGWLHSVTGWFAPAQGHVATLAQLAQTGLVVGTIPLSAAAALVAPHVTGTAHALPRPPAAVSVAAGVASARGDAPAPLRDAGPAVAGPAPQTRPVTLTPQPATSPTPQPWGLPWFGPDGGAGSSRDRHPHREPQDHPSHDPSRRPAVLDWLFHLDPLHEGPVRPLP